MILVSTEIIADKFKPQTSIVKLLVIHSREMREKELFLKS